MNAREIALDMMLSILEEQKLSHVVLKDGLAKHSELEKQDRAFISRLTTGCVERKITLDYDIERYSKVKVKKMKPIIRNILRMGVYQLKYMSQVPDSAVCNEAVKLAKKRGLTGLSGFVNGILRSMVRDKEALNIIPDKFSVNERLSYEYSMPLWIIEEWSKRYTNEQVKAILDAYLSEKETTVRCNTSLISVKELLELFEKEGVTVKEGNILDTAFRISGYDSLDRLESFNKGYFQVQDESSMLVGLIADVKPDNYVVDVCAAPGGKSLHAAELLCGTGHVDSRDKTERKVALINENIARIGYKNISTKAQDALELDESVVGKADIVIADLPCSGLGVIGKKSDIKYNVTKEMLTELSALQKDILRVVTQYVKKGGTLIYSTCTINSQENEKNVEFITKELGFQLESLDPYLPEKVHSETTKNGLLQILPYEYHTDGFFMARLRKN